MLTVARRWSALRASLRRPGPWRGLVSTTGLVVPLALGCGAHPPSDSLFDTAAGSATEASSGGSPGSSAGSATADGTGGTGDPTEDDVGDEGFKFDLALDAGAPGGCTDPDGQCEGCNAVDILFVIDNSTSMRSYQQALAAVAPDFADAIVDALPPGTDLHVGVTTSSFYSGGGTSPGEVNCEPYYAGAGMTDRDDLYDYYWTPDVMPFAENGAQGRLREHEGKTYFAVETDGDTQPMKDWLVGNIQAVGENGSVWEMMAAGAAYPFHPANAIHNAGFLRDAGAVLVIFALTDEVGNSPEDVEVYHDMIVAAKSECGGDACILTAGVMRPCLATAQDQRLYPLLASFGKDPIIADIGPELDDCFEDCEKGDITHCNAVQPPVTCAELAEGKATAHYADALGATLAQVIAETCEQIPPAG